MITFSDKKKKTRQLPKFYTKSYYHQGARGFGVGELPLVKRKEIFYAKIRKGDRVLDIGCGRGDILLSCAKKGAIPYGIDFSKDAIFLTKKTLGKFLQNGQVIKANALKLPFPENTFDKCICGDVIEHMSFDQAKKCLKEAFRVLKPNGILVVHTSPNSLFLKSVYPFARLVLRLIGKGKLADQLDEDLLDRGKYHVDEYNFFNFKRIIREIFRERGKIWMDKDILRPGSRYYSELQKNPLVRLAMPLISRPPFVYFFGNDFFAVCQK